MPLPTAELTFIILREETELQTGKGLSILSSLRIYDELSMSLWLVFYDVAGYT